MNDKIRLLTALAFDDLRLEASGAMSLMGVETDGQFEVAKFPQQRRLATAIVCDIIGVGEVRLFVKLRYNGEIKWAGETVLEIERTSSGVVIPVGNMIAAFDAPGELELLVNLDEDTSDDFSFTKTWHVLSPTDEEG